MNSNPLDITGFSDLSEAEKEQDRKDLEDLRVKTRKAISKLSDTVRSLRAAADYLDEVWRNSKTARAAGSSSGVAGGCLTIAGGIATVASMGLATPLLLAGLGMGFLGAGTNVVTSIREAAINSSEIEKAEEVWQETLASIDEVKATVKKWLLEKEKIRLLYIYHLAEQKLKFSDPAVVEILQKEVLPSLELKTQVGSALKGAALWVTAKAVTGAAITTGVQAGAQAAGGVLQGLTQVGTRAVASRLIVGAGAVCLLWDAKDLKNTIQDLVQNKGSDAARCLRQKADELESANLEEAAWPSG